MENVLKRLLAGKTYFMMLLEENGARCVCNILNNVEGVLLFLIVVVFLDPISHCGF
jgi:hypothetical protein